VQAKVALKHQSHVNSHDKKTISQDDNKNKPLPARRALEMTVNKRMKPISAANLRITVSTEVKRLSPNCTTQ